MSVASADAYPNANAKYVGPKIAATAEA